MLDANNLKGPGIELEFYDTTKFENMKGQITHYIALHDIMRHTMM